MQAACFVGPEGKAISSHLKLDGITQRGKPDDLNFFPLRKTHFQESNGHAVLPLNVHDRRPVAGS